MMPKPAHSLARLFLPLLILAPALVNPASTRADVFVYDSYNAPFTPGFLYWQASTFGYYWTPTEDILLAGIQTRLRNDAFNINNNFTMTTSFFDEHPDQGGNLLASVDSNAAVVVDGWVGNLFDNPVALTGGTTYFFGFSGWDQVLTPTGGGGVIFVDPLPENNPQLRELGNAYIGQDWSILVDNYAPLRFPVVRFLAKTQVIPEPSSIVLMGLSAALLGWNWHSRRRSKAHAL